MTGLKEKSALIREAHKALIERESARRLALLGGTEPHSKPTAPPTRQVMILVDTSAMTLRAAESSQSIV